MRHTWVERLMAATMTMAIVGTVGGCARGSDGSAGAVTTEQSSKPVHGGRLVYAIEGDPNGLDPSKNAWDANGIQLANALYDPLIAVGVDGRLEPYLAQSLSPSADFKTWTLRLRPGVSFHDGTPLTADAVVAFLFALKGSAITGPPTKMIAGARAVDPLTVEITTSQPWATLPVLLSGQAGYVVAPKQINDTEGHSKPIGTGPFKLMRWSVDRSFELVRNPAYWRSGLPYLDQVDFVVVAEGAQRIDRLTRGEVDVTSIYAEWDVARLDEVLESPSTREQIAVETDPSDTEKSFVVFNTTKAPFDDVRVRKALASATDVNALARDDGWPLDRLARGPFSPGAPFFTDAPFPTYDPDRARALVREYLSDRSVRNRPSAVSFTVTATDVDTSLTQKLVEQWKAVGITARINVVDAKDVVRLAVLGDYQAMPLRYFANVDPDALWHFFVGDAVKDVISLNFARFANPDITAGMNEGRSTLDRDRRKAAYGKVQAALAEQVPYLWLSRTEWRIAANQRVRDAHNVTLPDGREAQPVLGGTHRLTETWIAPG